MLTQEYSYVCITDEEKYSVRGAKTMVRSNRRGKQASRRINHDKAHGIVDQSTHQSLRSVMTTYLLVHALTCSIPSRNQLYAHHDMLTSVSVTYSFV